jgi:hypothetical protein
MAFLQAQQNVSKYSASGVNTSCKATEIPKAYTNKLMTTAVISVKLVLWQTFTDFTANNIKLRVTAT